MTSSYAARPSAAAWPQHAAVDGMSQFLRDLANSTSSESDLLDRLAVAAVDLAHAESTWVLELDGDGYYAVASAGLNAAFRGPIYQIQPGPSLFREAITTRKPVLTNDADDPRIDPRFREPLHIQHVLVVPIVLDNAVQGLLLCINAVTGAFTADDADLLVRLADYSALVLRSQRLMQRAERAVVDARARAEDAARAAQHHAVLARTSRMFADAMTRESVFDGVAEVLRTELAAAGFAVYEADARLRTVRVGYQWGIGRVDEPHIVKVFHQSILGDVLRRGTPEFHEDVRQYPHLIEQMGGHNLIDEGILAIAMLPLVLDGQPRGVLSIRYVGVHHFDDDERRLLTDIATQVAIAYRNLNHLAELERRAERLGAMATAQQQLTHVTTAESLPAAIAEAVHRVIPCAQCDVLAMTSEGLERVLQTEHGQIVVTQPIRAAELALANETLRTGVARLAIGVNDTDGAARGTSELCAVVRYANRNSGVLRLRSPSPDAFDLQDLDLLTILGRQAGASVETTRLFTLQDQQRQRAEGAAELARVALHAVSLDVAARDLIATLDRLVPSIGKAIGVFRSRENAVEYVATSGTLDVLRGRHLISARGLSAITPDGRPCVVERLSTITGAIGLETPLADEWGFVVPLNARERSLGLLLVSAPPSVPLPRRDRVTLERLSTSLAIALDALLLDEEERLAREREHLLATALTTIDHPIFILDRSGMRYANPAAAREYGWSQHELMEMQFEQLIVERVTKSAESLAELHAEHPDAVHGMSLTEHVHRRRDGSEFPAVVTASALLAADGGVLGQVVSVRNVSSERRAEEQLRHTEKMVALGELVAGVAHEINNPLTGISAFAQLLLEEPLVGDQRESVQLIKQEADRAKAVIADLLIFARRAEPRIGPVALNELIGQTLRLRAYPLRLAGVSVSVQLDPHTPPVSGDLQKLQQVIINLIANAEHAMSDTASRTLTIRTSFTGEHVRIDVVDTGRGMPHEVRRRIFEPFFTTKQAGFGTGLGLSVSYGIVQAHGGRIDIDSELGVGTTASVFLPLNSPFVPLADQPPTELIADMPSASNARS